MSQRWLLLHLFIQLLHSRFLLCYWLLRPDGRFVLCNWHLRLGGGFVLNNRLLRLGGGFVLCNWLLRLGGRFVLCYGPRLGRRSMMHHHMLCNRLVYNYRP